MGGGRRDRRDPLPVAVADEQRRSRLDEGCVRGVPKQKVRPDLGKYTKEKEN